MQRVKDLNWSRTSQHFEHLLAPAIGSIFRHRKGICYATIPERTHGHGMMSTDKHRKAETVKNSQLSRKEKTRNAASKTLRLSAIKSTVTGTKVDFARVISRFHTSISACPHSTVLVRTLLLAIGIVCTSKIFIFLTPRRQNANPVLCCRCRCHFLHLLNKVMCARILSGN